jgi:hypothetical protein
LACRRATLADAVDGARLLLDFHSAASLPFPRSPAWAHAMFCDHVTDPAKLALVTDGGVLLGIVGNSMLGPFRQAQEIVWWLDPAKRSNGDGQDMLARYEEWAINMGALMIGAASLSIMPEVERLYERRGYSRLETHWVMVVK